MRTAPMGWAADHGTQRRAGAERAVVGRGLRSGVGRLAVGRGVRRLTRAERVVFGCADDLGLEGRRSAAASAWSIAAWGAEGGSRSLDALNSRY